MARVKQLTNVNKWINEWMTTIFYSVFLIDECPLQASKKYFVITFLGSIGWIAIFSYLMVWWAHQVSLQHIYIYI